jgi:hypothetical protein
MTTRRPDISPAFGHPAIALLFTCLLASCSADFQSGVTKCSATGTCPEGFTCNTATKLCTTPGGNQGPVGTDASVPSGTGGSNGTPTGTGGAKGTGGTTTTPGTGGTTPTPDAGPPPPLTCTDPEHPVACPSAAGGSCAPAGSDCSTIMKCGTDPDPFVCKTGEVVNCQYAMSNPCSPKNNMCPTGRDPSKTQFCPAKGGAGPLCASTNADCATLMVCPFGPILCAKGNVADCKYQANPCGPASAAGCSDPQFPKFCPALGAVGPGCFSATTDCSTVAVCGDDIAACGTGFHPDCAMGKCVAN